MSKEVHAADRLIVAHTTAAVDREHIGDPLFGELLEGWATNKAGFVINTDARYNESKIPGLDEAADKFVRDVVVWENPKAVLVFEARSAPTEHRILISSAHPLGTDRAYHDPRVEFTAYLQPAGHSGVRAHAGRLGTGISLAVRKNDKIDEGTFNTMHQRILALAQKGR